MRTKHLQPRTFCLRPPNEDNLLPGKFEEKNKAVVRETLYVNLFVVWFDCKPSFKKKNILGQRRTQRGSHRPHWFICLTFCMAFFNRFRLSFLHVCFLDPHISLDILCLRQITTSKSQNLSRMHIIKYVHSRWTFDFDFIILSKSTLFLRCVFFTGPWDSFRGRWSARWQSWCHGRWNTGSRAWSHGSSGAGSRDEIRSRLSARLRG